MAFISDILRIPPFFILLFLVAAADVRAQTYPRPILNGDARLSASPYNSTGYISTKVGRDYFRGSGAVARDGRLIYSCGHNFYESGRWATDVRFARGYSGKPKPPKKATATVRGFRLLAGYNPTESDYDFPDDFAVAYGHTSFGNPLTVLSATDSVAALTSNVEKMKLGYPADLDYDLSPGYHYLHQTGPFWAKFTQESGAYYGTTAASTGGGNSGGPVLVMADGSYSLAGVLVSGNNYGDPDFIGIRAMNIESEEAADSALDYAAEGAPERVALNRPIWMRDGSKAFRRAQFRFRKIPSFITRAVMSLYIDARDGDVDVTLRSPRGRTHTLVSSQNASTWTDTWTNNLDVSGSFASRSDSNGSWTLLFRDVRPGYPAYVHEATALTLYTK